LFDADREAIGFPAQIADPLHCPLPKADCRMHFIPQLLIIVLMLASFRLLAEAGNGARLITFSRRSSEPADAALARLQRAFDNTGGVFEPVDAISDDEDGARTVYFRQKDKKMRIRIRPLADLDAGQVGVAVLGANGLYMRTGEEMTEIWSVAPDHEGCRMTVSIRLFAGPKHVLRSIFAARRQLRAFIGGKQTYQHKPPVEPPFGAVSPLDAPVKRRGVISSFDPREYGFEIAMSLFAFAVLLVQFDLVSAVQLTIVILVHEYGHYLSFKLTGKQQNRIMLLPFMGGLAVSATPHRSEFERAFCALAGPAICVPLSLAAFAYFYFSSDYAADAQWAVGIAYFSCLLNALNLLPIYPLDGAHVAEGFLRSFGRNILMQAMMALALAGLLLLLWLGYRQMAILIAVIGLPGLIRRGAMPSVRPMNLMESAAIGIGYILTLATHAGLYWYGWGF
jgi:Zn-dependent protease